MFGFSATKSGITFGKKRSAIIDLALLLLLFFSLVFLRKRRVNKKIKRVDFLITGGQPTERRGGRESKHPAHIERVAEKIWQRSEPISNKTGLSSPMAKKEWNRTSLKPDLI